MSNRGTILLAVGMLVLGLVLGLGAGSAAGFFAGQSRAVAVGARGAVPFQQMPNQQLPNQQQPVQPPSQQQPFQQPAPFPTPRRNQQQAVTLGAQVEEVVKDSPAEKAGVKVGDVITAVGGAKIDANHALADLIQAKKPGDKVDLALTRDGKEMTLTVELGKSTDNASAAYLGIRYSSTIPGNRGRFPNG